MPDPSRTVVVVDDSSRFPLHVWRYLSQSLGLGIGYVRTDGRVHWGEREDEKERWICAVDHRSITGDGSVLSSDDGAIRVLWVRADGRWRAALERALEIAPADQVMVLVDIHGEGDYQAHAVLHAAERGGRAECLLVSAYSSVSQESAGRRIWPKSRDTLKEIERRLRPPVMGGEGWPGGGGAPASPRHACHLLVTGAGFELRSGQGGFGLPHTAEVLSEMKGPFDSSSALALELLPLKRDEIRRASQRSGRASPDAAETFPVPAEARGAYRRQIQAAAGIAGEKDLDTYWDLLLEHELYSVLDPSHAAASGSPRDARKVQALRRERQMREAFRASLLQYDWGYLRQALIAARLPWRAWLTTNYTRFADRAIALEGEGRWRSVSTAAEGRMLVRDTSSPAGGQDGDRYLFKLHGDIAHLQTMAIAGNDKDTFSPLSVPIDDLYQLYEVALSRVTELATTAPAVVVWHVVGHALRDQRLVGLVRRSAHAIQAEGHAEGRGQVFLVADKDPGGVCAQLRGALSGIEATLFAFELTAAQYMARLDRGGLPDFQAAEECGAWSTGMGGRKVE